MLVANPLSRVNVAGLALAALSPCLLSVEWEGARWHERHAPFLFALATGVLLAALYRRVVVERDGIAVVVGAWPLRLRRALPVAGMVRVTLDGRWVKNGTTYEAGLDWRDHGARERSVALLKGSWPVVDAACRLAEDLGLPLRASDSFWRGASDDARSTVRACAERTADGPNPG